MIWNEQSFSPELIFALQIMDSSHVSQWFDFDSVIKNSLDRNLSPHQTEMPITIFSEIMIISFEVNNKNMM
jgi:hypothetical protein